MGTNRTDIYEQLKNILFSDDAVCGEAAALAIGLLMISSKSYSVISDMLTVSEIRHFSQSKMKNKIRYLRYFVIMYEFLVRRRYSTRKNPSRIGCRHRVNHVRRFGRRGQYYKYVVSG